MLKINFKKFLGILLSLLFISGGDISLLAKPVIGYRYGVSRNEEAVAEYCSFSNNNKECSFYRKYAGLKTKQWQLYEQAFWSVEDTPYWKLSPTELFDIYQKVSSDIAYLWSTDPEYEGAKTRATLRKVAIAENVLAMALMGGYAAGSVLIKAGFTMSGNMASLVPIGSSVVRNGVRFSLQSALRYITSNIVSGKFWADIGLTMLVMVGDALMAEGAFYTFYTLDEELTGALSANQTIDGALKVRNLVHEIVNPNLSAQTQKALATSQQAAEPNKQLIKELRQAVENQFQNNKWGSDEDIAFMTHYESVVTLYALEYLRAELSDLKDGLRYRKAAIDLAGIYFSDNLTQLMERQELTAMLKQAIDIQKEEERKKTKEAMQSLIGFQNDSIGFNTIGGMHR